MHYLCGVQNPVMRFVSVCVSGGTPSGLSLPDRVAGVKKFKGDRMKMKKMFAAALLLAAWAFVPVPGGACTGITLQSKDSTTIVARTFEWGSSDLNSRYIVVPRGHAEQSYTPVGMDGMKFTARYGYVGLAVERKEFLAEGLNEAGLSAGLFYFPRYGSYEAYDEARKDSCVSDLQLVAYLLGSCRTVDEVKEAVRQVCVVGIDPQASTVHWRFADQSGRQLVLEIVDGRLCFYENSLGVLANSPGFEWQLVNLNNYINLFPGSVPSRQLGRLELSAFGAGSGMLGIPGDVTSPSRFVRAAFYQATASRRETARETVFQAFQILNNFDIPIGIEFADGEAPADIPSATQWASATDMRHRLIYFRTMYDSTVRCIDLNDIDFAKVAYVVAPLDADRQQPLENIRIASKKGKR